jgi:hypothetical protein
MWIGSNAGPRLLGKPLQQLSTRKQEPISKTDVRQLALLRLRIHRIGRYAQQFRRFARSQE